MSYFIFLLYVYHSFTHIINDKVLLFIYMIWIYVWLSFIDKKVSHPNNRYEGIILTVLSSCIFINIYFALFLLLRSFVHMLNNRLE